MSLFDNTWNNIEEFWNKTNINNISEQYINLKNENINNLNNKFSWIHDEDKPFINTDNCKAADWGIPNQVLGNLENAKIIIGLFNPKSHMSNSQANKCLSVNEYIKNELAESQNDYNLEAHEFFINIEDYKNHIFSKDNVISQELKSLYKLHNESVPILDQKQTEIKKVAYYYILYFSKSFNKPFREVNTYYKNMFDKINKLKSYSSSNYDIENEFYFHLSTMRIYNVELVPYRSKNKNDLKVKTDKLPSSIFIAKQIINCILNEKDIKNKPKVILRSIKDWVNVMQKICEKLDINFNKEIAPYLYSFKSQNAALSQNNILPYTTKNQNVSEVINLIYQEISLTNFYQIICQRLEDIN